MSDATVKTAIFPVAGLGTRFLPATKATPKELLPVIDAANVFESTSPSFTVTLNDGATSSPLSTNTTWFADSCALVKLVIGVPTSVVSWK